MVAFRISSFICHSFSFFSILSGTLNALIRAVLCRCNCGCMGICYNKNSIHAICQLQQELYLKLYADEESAMILQLHEDNVSRMCHSKNYFYANYSNSNTHICKIVVVCLIIFKPVYMYLNYILFLGMYMYLSSLCLIVLINYAEINKYIN